MKCENVGLGRRCRVKDRGFKHTPEELARNMLHLMDLDELIIIDKCSIHDMVLVKESLQNKNFFMVARQDLDNLSGKLKKGKSSIKSNELPNK